MYVYVPHTQSGWMSVLPPVRPSVCLSALESIYEFCRLIRRCGNMGDAFLRWMRSALFVCLSNLYISLVYAQPPPPSTPPPQPPPTSIDAVFAATSARLFYLQRRGILLLLLLPPPVDHDVDDDVLDKEYKYITSIACVRRSVRDLFSNSQLRIRNRSGKKKFPTQFRM